MIRDLIEAYIKPMWPEWEPPSHEIELWCDRLGNYPEKAVIKAVDEFKAGEKGSQRKPILYVILKILKTRYRNSTQRLVNGYSLQRLNAETATNIAVPERIFNDPDRMMIGAETLRQKYEILYGGKWFITRGDGKCL